jgi:hypothetical protein
MSKTFLLAVTACAAFGAAWLGCGSSSGPGGSGSGASSSNASSASPSSSNASSASASGSGGSGGAGTASSSQSTGGAGGGMSCSQTGDCTACTSCAINGPCAAVWQACQASSDCMDVDQCFATCSDDPTCEQACYAADPAGAPDYMAAFNCVECEQCAMVCGTCNM